MHRSFLRKEYTLFRVNRVPVVARPSFGLAICFLWGLLSWLAGQRRADRSWLQRLLVGGLALPLPLLADEGHAMAHTVSARLAAAPMDKILLSAGMPRTLYADNDVSPNTHRLRALGGPLYSTFGLLFSLFWLRRARPGSLNRELADISSASHAFILLGSLAPLPFVDGGTLLKWTLVARGRSPDEADRMVHRTSMAAGAVLLGVGTLLTMAKRRILALLSMVAGAIAVAAGLDLIR